MSKKSAEKLSLNGQNQNGSETMDFYKQYPSGLKLVARKLENFYTVSFGVYVDVGSVKESDANNGYSHFIEHLLFKGTERRTSQQISEEMDDIGANLNAYTAKDCTCFYTKSVASDLEKCMDLLSDMFFFAKFDDVELQREKSVVVEEINMCEDTPDDVSQDLISNALFFEQPLGQTILGNAANIKNSDRHSIKNFKETHYIPSNTVLTVAGNFEFDKLDKLVEKYFESNCPKQFEQDEITLQTSYTNKFLHKFKKIEQSHLEIAVGGCSLSSPKRYALSVLTGVLGGGMSSRLFQSVREKHGLAYSVYSYPSYYSDCGMLETYVGLSPDNIGEVCRLLQQEICLLLEKGITQAELNRAKAQAVNGLYMNIESNMTLMRLYGRCMLKTGKLYNAETEVENYKAVTVEEVNALARELFAQNFASSYVGKDVKNFDEISKLKF